MRSTKLAVAAMTVCTMNAWAINKCTMPDGKVAYQETPCFEASKGEELKVRSTKASSAYQLELQERIDRAAVACGMESVPAFPEIGWTETQFLQCSRIALVQRPSAVNVTESSGTVAKQYVYNDIRAYIYTRNGLVTTIQKRR